MEYFLLDAPMLWHDACWHRMVNAFFLREMVDHRCMMFNLRRGSVSAMGMLRQARGPKQPAGFAHVRPQAIAKMPECWCTGCANANCGLAHYQGRHTCGNTVRVRGMPSMKGVCISCYCYDCNNFPCACRSRRVDERGGDSTVWQNSRYYGNCNDQIQRCGGSSSSWQTSIGDGNVQGWWWQSSTRQWLRPSGNGNDQATMPALNDAPYDAASIGNTSTSISDVVQLIEDLLARVRALENEVAAMKDAEGKQSQ